MRSHYCGGVNESHVDQEVTVCGWAHRRRDHGGVIFIDLRDREGLLQVVYDPDIPDVFSTAESVRNEFVLKVTGKVRLRPKGTENPNMPTGQVEVLGKQLEILNRSETPPFSRKNTVCAIAILICVAHRCCSIYSYVRKSRLTYVISSIATVSWISKPRC